MKHLLINCDLAWVPSIDRLRSEFGSRFDEITILPPTAALSEFALDTVTHWITNPAPREKISAELVNAKLPRLTFIGSPSTGVTHIDPRLFESSITVRCLRDIPPEKLNQITASSEYTFFAFLALVRKAKAVLSTDLTEWRDNLPKFRGRQVAGMRILIFGYGRIGSNVARYLEAFGASVQIYEPDSTKHDDKFGFIERTNIAVTLPDMDAVFLCFHWSEENENFFGRAYLDAMRDDAYLVNTSRGENLDENFLATLIEKGKFAGIALDVLRNEQSPKFEASPILPLADKCERLLVSPHIAGASFDSERLAFQFIAELIA